MVVPLFEAIITRAQYNGSAPLVFEIPYKGNCEHTKNTNNATVVYKTFSLKGIFLSACFTSGRNGRNGLTKFSNRKLEDIFSYRKYPKREREREGRRERGKNVTRSD